MKNQKSKTPKISIITPSLNQGRFLEENILSVKGQNYQNYEHIIVDGGSTDETERTLKKYKDDLIIIQGQDKGQTDAINIGLRKAKGEILAYLNCDDYYEKDTFIKVVRYFYKNPEIFWVVGESKIVDKEGKITRSLISDWKNFWFKVAKKTDYKKILLILNYISQPSVFFKREVIKDLGLFDLSYDYSMDYEYWLKLSQKYSLGFINDKLSKFRIQKDSKSVRKFIDQIKEAEIIAKKYTDNSNLLNLRQIHDKIMLIVYKLINNG